MKSVVTHAHVADSSSHVVQMHDCGRASASLVLLNTTVYHCCDMLYIL